MDINKYIQLPLGPKSQMINSEVNMDLTGAEAFFSQLLNFSYLIPKYVSTFTIVYFYAKIIQ